MASEKTTGKFLFDSSQKLCVRGGKRLRGKKSNCGSVETWHKSILRSSKTVFDGAYLLCCLIDVYVNVSFQMAHWVKETSIHGLHELILFRRGQRVFWVFFLIAVFGWCILQLVSLIAAYVDLVSITDVVEPEAGLPDLVLRVGAAPFLAKETMEGPERFISNYAFRGGISDSGCVGDVPNHNPLAINYTEYDAESKQLSEYTNESSVPFFEAMRDAAEKQILGLRRSAKNADFIVTDLPTDDMLEYKLGATGPMIIVKLSTLSPENTSMATVTLRKSNLRLFLAGGDEAQHLDHKKTDSYLVLTKGVFNVLQFRLRQTQYKRHTRLCRDDHTNAQLSCVGLCQVRKAQQDNGCVPFFGDVKGIDDVRRCGHRDTEQCTAAFRECQEYCHMCKACKSCKETKVHFEYMLHDKTGQNAFSLSVLFTGEPQAYYARPQYDLASFMSQIGGTLGLCFGMSVISIAQVLCACIEVGKKKREKGAVVIV